MRIRTIKPEFFTHEGLFDLEVETGLPVRVAFAGLWCAADREGRFKWEPRRLKTHVLPYDEVDFSRVLDALMTRGFVVRYAWQGREFGVIPAFKTHQVINNREKPSALPCPSQCVDSEDVDACGTREARVGHAGKAEGKGREGKGSTPIVPRGDDDDDELSLDGDAAERSDSADSETVPAAKKKRGGGGAALMEAAGRVYALYPRKVGRDKALRAIVKRLEAGVELEVLMEATGAYAAAVKRWPAEDRVYVPHAASWFNAGGYDDDRREWVRGEAAGPAAAAAPAAVGAMTSGGGGGDGPEGWMEVMEELYGDAWRDGWVPRWWELVASQRRAVLERMKGA